MSSMMRQSTHTSSTVSPKRRLNIFSSKKRTVSTLASRNGNSASDKIYEPQLSDEIPTSPCFSFLELEQSRSNNGLSPDSLIGVMNDLEYLYLRENIWRIKKAPSGPDPKKVDLVWEVYKKLREECLQLCKSLLQKSRKMPYIFDGGIPQSKVNEVQSYPSKCWSVSVPGQKSCQCQLFEGKEVLMIPKDAFLGGVFCIENNSYNASLGSLNFGPIDSRSISNSSITETSLPFHVNEQWLAAINEYKTVQTSILETLRASLLATYKSYEPEAAFPQLDAFLKDKTVRKNLIAKWREESVHRMRSEKLLFWEQYRIRSLNFDRLRVDLEDIINLFGDAKESDNPNRTVQEYVIAKNGDTVLEFANAASEISLHPILRFRVSSQLLAGSSPLFAQFLSPQKLKGDTPFDMIGQLPPPPSRYSYKDEPDVKLYRMPQIEFNQNDALFILLHAAHMHHAKVPSQIDFPVFVSIADVCLRYRCTSPLELQVEYQWLPQWIHMIGDESIDGFLRISYAFGLRRIFTRMSKSAILNSLDDDEIQSKEFWPQAVRDKIQDTRAAKIGQVYECCQRVVSTYFRAPARVIDRGTGVGSLRLTSAARCPKGSHVCDATNLGWIMLLFNELQLLPDIVGRSSLLDLPSTPRRSLKELVDCLRLVSSPPGVHSGVCNYAASFRSDIEDIYNSVTGLTLFDVSGKNGWALSKHAGSTEDRYDDVARDRIESESPLEYQYMHKSIVAMSNEDISLRILSHLHDFDDLISAAMVDKTFYRAYKQDEAALLKNVIKEDEKERTILQLEANTAVPALNRLFASRTELRIIPDEQKSLGSDELRPAPADTTTMGNQLYDSSPPFSPISPENMTEEEAVKILWPDVVTEEESIPHRNDRRDRLTEKCLVGEVLFVENKSRVIDDEKNLRDEKDQALGFGSWI